MSEHSFEGLAKPFEFALMATLGCFVGHIFMYPFGLFELSGQLGAGLSNLFNGAAAVDPLGSFDALGSDLTSGISADPVTSAGGFEHAAVEQTHTFTKGDPGFEDCVASGGATHFHGAELVCHEPQ